jgi:beta-xylosidase
MSLLASLALVAAQSTFVATENPVFAGADPHALVVGDRVWVFPTRGANQGFTALSSADLVRWTDHGSVLSLDDVKWIRDDGAERHYPWAPGVAERDGKYYMYFSVGPQNPTPSRIGVAVADQPEGPYRDSGKPLLIGGNGFEAIDAMAFRDPKSRRWYFYAGGSAGAKLRIFELNDDMVSFRREVPVRTPKFFTEGAFIHYRRGTYYLSYSHGGYRDQSYSSHYATSGTPYGPWRYGGRILASDATHKGPGHHSIFNLPGTDDWWIAYHRWEDQTGPGPYRGSRQVAFERLEHGLGGILRPVTMTDEVPRIKLK